MLKSNFLNDRRITHLLFIVALAALLWLLKVFTLGLYPDVAAYYFGAERILVGADPYLTDRNYFTYQVYPPFSLVFFSPLTLFAIEVASIVWIALSIVCLFGVILFITNTYKKKIYSKLTLTIIILALISFPLKFTLGMGQINIIVLFFVTGFFYFLNKKKEYLAGLFLTLSLLLKFFPVLILIYLVFLRKWKIIIICISSLLFFQAFTLLFVPIDIQKKYFQFILPELISSWKGDYYNQSLAGFLIRAISSQDISNVLRIIITITMVIITFIPILIKKNKTEKRINVEIASLITLNVIINNFSWQHHFIFLLLPFIILTYSLPKMKNRIVAYCILLVSYALIAGNLKNPNLVPLLLQSHVFFGGVLLWGIFIYMLLRYKF